MSDKIMSTVMLNLSKVEETHPVARQVMLTCAFLHPADIPYEIILEWFPTDYSFPEGRDREAVVSETLHMLRSFSLLSVDPIERLVWMHELTSGPVRAAMNRAELLSHLEGILNAMDRIFPLVGPDTWSQGIRLISHTLVLLRFAGEYGMGSNEASQSLLQKACNYLESRGEINSAQALRTNAFVF